MGPFGISNWFYNMKKFHTSYALLAETLTFGTLQSHISNVTFEITGLFFFKPDSCYIRTKMTFHFTKHLN